MQNFSCEGRTLSLVHLFFPPSFIPSFFQAVTQGHVIFPHTLGQLHLTNTSYSKKTLPILVTQRNRTSASPVAPARHNIGIFPAAPSVDGIRIIDNEQLSSVQEDTERLRNQLFPPMELSRKKSGNAGKHSYEKKKVANKRKIMLKNHKGRVGRRTEFKMLAQEDSELTASHR